MLTFQTFSLLSPFSVFHPRRLRKSCQKRRCRPKDDQTDLNEAEDTAQELHDHIDPFEERQTPVYILQSTTVDPVRPIQYPSWYGHHGNLILAIVIFLAARLGRSTTEQHRLDSYGTQTPMEGIVGVSKDLALRRKQQQETEALMKETEAKKRMKNALEKAKNETLRKQERERKYQAEQEQEMKRLQAEQQRQKQAFEEQEKRMQTELEKRLEIEKQIQQDLENKRKAEVEEQRRLAAEQDRLERERKAAEEAEKQRQIELQKQQREADRRALDKLKTKFAVRVESELFIKRSSSGVKTTKPPTQQALVSITLKMKPSISESFTTLEDHFVDLEDARDSIGKLIGFVCNGTMDEYLSDIRLQSMQGTGPLTLMDDKELELFASFASLHTHFLTQKTTQKLLDSFESTGSVSSYEDKLQVRTEWGVLPRDHEKSLNLTIDSILKQASEKEATVSTLKESLNKIINSEVQDLCSKHETSKDFTEAIFASYLAYIHDRALDFKDSALYESITPLLHELLTNQCQQSKPDTLQDQSTALSYSLPDGNPIIEWFESLSRKNLSAGRRQAAQEKQQRLDAIARARILEEQWPDRQQIAAELIKEREEKTPIPERVWAMRNVAKTLLITSSSSESALTKARKLMEDAIQLQKDHFDAHDHPGLLGSLKDYADIKAKMDMEKAVLVWEEIVQILGAVCDRYRRQGELYSAALCAETAVLNGESFLDVRHPLITKLGKASEALFNVLNEKEKTKLLELRKSRGGLSVISEAFATQLGVYRVPGKVDRSEQWTNNLDLDPL